GRIARQVTAAEQQARRLDAELSGRLADRGERGRQKARLFDVVEPRQGDVVRDRQATRLQRLERAERHPIVGGDDGVDRQLSLVEELGDGVMTATQAEIAAVHQRVVDNEPEVGERLPITVEALLALAARTVDERDAPPSVVDQKV